MSGQKQNLKKRVKKRLAKITEDDYVTLMILLLAKGNRVRILFGPKDVCHFRQIRCVLSDLLITT